jgi:hypothetical protein
MAAIQNSISVQQLLQQHLRRRGINLTDQLTLELCEKAIAACGVGLDHSLGEHVLAIGDYSMHHDLSIFFMLTDRRVAGRRGRIFFHAPLHEITQVVDRTNLITANLKIQLSSGQIADATVGSFSRPLGAYLSGLCRLHPAQRVPAPQPIPTPTADQLTSVHWLNANRTQLNAVCEQMLRVVSARLRLSQITIEAARNLVSRIFLHNRNAGYGRGMQNSWWMSALTVVDLGQALQWLLGQPIGTYQQENLFTFDFTVGGGGNAGRAAASTAVGLAAAGLLGFGWVSIPGKSVRQIRVSLSGGAGTTYLGVQGLNTANFEPLSAVQPVVMARLLHALISYEQSLLYRRVLYGWDARPEELIVKSDEELRTQLATVTDVAF